MAGLRACSQDHRGTPEFPGRVVTLIERSIWQTLETEVSRVAGRHSLELIGHGQQRDTESERVWGAAYHIIPSKVDEVKEYLDIREINGYSVQYTNFRPVDSTLRTIRCLVYIGMPDNPQFTGPVAPQDLAERINRCVGPSGENRDYLLQLEASLRDLSAESGDAHVNDLTRRVRLMEPWKTDQRLDDSQDLSLRGVSSSEAQEETEKPH